METNVLEQLRYKVPTLTDSQKKVADYILKNPLEVIFLTIDQLSNTIGTSTSTIMRLAFSLGYSGYADFQKDLQELLRYRVAPSVRLNANIKDLEHNNLLTKCAEKQIDNLQKTLEVLSAESLENALEMILSADKIYLSGVRTVHSVAHYLYQNLNRLLGNCELLIPGTGDLPERVSALNSSSVLIAISLPRYQRTITEITQIAAKQNSKVIALTDGYSSPLASYANVLLPFNYGSLAFHNSVIGAMLIADYIITAIASKKPESMRQRLEEVERIFDDWDFLISK